MVVGCFEFGMVAAVLACFQEVAFPVVSVLFGVV